MARTHPEATLLYLAPLPEPDVRGSVFIAIDQEGRTVGTVVAQYGMDAVELFRESLPGYMFTCAPELRDAAHAFRLPVVPGSELVRYARLAAAWSGRYFPLPAPGELARAFLRAAAEFYRAAPWNVPGCPMPLLVHAGGALDGPFAVSFRKARGRRAAWVAVQEVDRATGRQFGPFWQITFDRNPEWLRRIGRYTCDMDAVPVPTRFDDGDVWSRPRDSELLGLTAILGLLRKIPQHASGSLESDVCVGDDDVCHVSTAFEPIRPRQRTLRLIH